MESDPGGATYLLNRTEDAALVLRRGRWKRVMTIYLQEIAVATAFPKLSESTRTKIQRFNSFFPLLLSTALRYLDFKILCSIWYRLLTAASTVEAS